MFRERDIIYFKPFYFKNGNTAKNKFFVVLKIINKKTILASLPTSKDHIPSNQPQSEGCIELPKANFNCFAIDESVCVTECGKHFQRKTFLYAAHIDDYEINTLEDIYPFESINYDVWGRMQQELFSQILHCFINSRAIKRKYRRMLSL